MIEDPFAPPTARLDERPIPLDREAHLALRRDNLAVEEKLKRGGAWLVLTGLELILFGALAIVFSIIRNTDSYYWAILLVPLGISYVAGGMALIFLVPGSNVPASLLAYLLFFGFPIGTAICAYVSHVCMKAIGSPVLTADYKRAIEATPDLKTDAWSPALSIGALVLAIGAAWAAWAWF